MSGASARRLDWGRRALDAYVSTLIHIGSENRQSAYLVEERVDRALALILAHPGLGTRSILEYLLSPVQKAWHEAGRER